MRQFIRAIFCILIIAFCSCDNADRNIYKRNYTDEELRQLEAKVTLIDRLDNITANQYTDTYFQLGDAYYQHKQCDAATVAFEKGLRLDPWNYLYLLKLALLEFSNKGYPKAYRRLTVVADNCMDEKLCGLAKRYMTKREFKDINKAIITLPDMRSYSLYLVSFNKTSAVLTSAVAARLAQDFRIHVEILSDTLIPDRKNQNDPREELFNETIAMSKSSSSRAEYQTMLKQVGLASDRNLTLADKAKIVHYLCGKEKDGEQLWLSIIAIPEQYDAEILLEQLEERYKYLLGNERVLGVLALTSEDIYSTGLNYVFGSARPKLGVVSYARFMDENTPIDIAVKRTVMQAFSTTGFMIEIPRCSTPNCARAFPNSLEEHDRKDDILCDECLENLKVKYREL